MSKDDKKFLKNFNFYIKLVDIDKVKEADNEDKIFKIIKTNKTKDEKVNNSFSHSFPTTKQDENFEENSEVSSMFKYKLNCIYNSNNTKNAYFNCKLDQQIMKNSNNNNICGFPVVNYENNYLLSNNTINKNNDFHLYYPSSSIDNDNLNSHNVYCKSNFIDIVSNDLNEIFINNVNIINILKQSDEKGKFSNNYVKYLENIIENYNNVNKQI